MRVKRGDSRIMMVCFLPTQECLPSTLPPIINKAIFIIYSQNPLQPSHDELKKKMRHVEIHKNLCVWNMIDES